MQGRTNCGGNLNLHLIAGGTKPESAAENTIWLDTEETVTNWCVQNTAPESPEAGNVYITTRSATNNKLDIGSARSVLLYLGTARQYVSGAWKDLDGEVFYSSAWHKIQTFAYDGMLNAGVGNYNSEIGGEWSASGGTLTNETDYFQYTTLIQGTLSVGSQKAIDFTDINTVKITYTRTSGGNRNVRFVIYLNTASSATIEAEAPATSASGKNTITIDTTSLSGNYYIGYRDVVNTGTGVLKVYEIELIS